MCLFPFRAEPQEFGRPKFDHEGSLHLPCGKCSECRSKRASEWALRCAHEIAQNDENCFLTLTYDDENLPSPLIVKEYFQNFMKKLRKHCKSKVKYIVSHEYGSKTGRPHHHAIIFGFNPSSQTFLKTAPSGEPLFTSPIIEKLWKHGFHSIGTANERTAYYIASYALKSSTTDVVIDSSGEIRTLSDSMDASKRPAIGHDYFIKNAEQLVNTNTQLPRYYLKLMEKIALGEHRIYNSKKIINKFSDLLELYENKRAEENMDRQQRGSHEKLAKYVITEQLKSLSDDTFRSAPENAQKKKLYEQHLRYERDSYALYKRKENL